MISSNNGVIVLNQSDIAASVMVNGILHYKSSYPHYRYLTQIHIETELVSFLERRMGGNEKRSLCMGILVILLLFSRATSLNFNSTTYHCNASVHECLVMDGIDSEFLMDSETSRMLAGQRRTRSLAQKAVEIRKRPAIECGRGKSYPSCEPQINPHKKDCTGIYCRTTN